MSRPTSGASGNARTSPALSTHGREVSWRQNDSSAVAMSELLKSLDNEDKDSYRSMWSNVSPMLCCSCTLLSAFQAAFDSTTTFLWIFSYLLDLIFGVELSVEFFQTWTAHSLKHHRTNPSCKRWRWAALASDAISLFPTDVIAVILGGNYWLYTLSLCRLNRILRIRRVIQFLNQWEFQLNSHTTSVQATKFALFTTVLIHLQACVWYSIACSKGNCFENRWHDELIVPESNAFQRYILSVYWTVTTGTAVGYGDLRPHVLGEKIFAIFSMTSGVFIFGYLFGSIASSIANSDSRRAVFEEHFNAVRQHLLTEQVDSNLSSRCLNYLRYFWARKSGVESDGLFSDIPVGLQADVRRAATVNMLAESSILRSCDEGLLRMLSLRVKSVLYLPNECIISHNNFSHSMFYIARGSVQVKGPDGELHKELGDGTILGEIPMVLGFRSSIEVTAKTACDVLLLDKTDLDDILTHYGSMKLKIERDARLKIDSAVSGQESANKKIISNLSRPSTRRYTTRRARINSVHPAAAQHLDSTDIEKRNPSNSSISHPIRSKMWCLFDFSNFFTKMASINEDQYFRPVELVFTLLSIVLITSECALYFRSGAVLVLLYLVEAVCWICCVCQYKYERRLTFRGLITQRSIAIIANIPIELIPICGGHRFDSRIVALARLNRVLRWHRSHCIFYEMQNTYADIASRIRGCELVVAACVTAHTTSCFWSMARAEKSIEPKYVTALYWSVATMTSTGYGDLVPDSQLQRIVAISAMMLGQLVFGIALATIAAVLSNSARTKVNAEAHLAAVRRYCLDHRVHPLFRQKAISYFRQHWQRYGGISIAPLLDSMPHSLRSELCETEYGSLLRSFPLLNGIHGPLLQRILPRLQRLFIMPYDTILHKGDHGQVMYFIVRGVVDIMDSDNVKTVTQLGHGQYFGEIGMLFKKPRLNSVRAATYCELVTLSRADIENAAIHYPSFLQLLQNITKNKEQFVAAEHAVSLNDAIGTTAKGASGRWDVVRRLYMLLRVSGNRKLPLHKNSETTQETQKRRIPCLARVVGGFVKWHSSIPTVQPASNFAIWWEMIQILFSTFVVFAVPIQAAFASEQHKLWLCLAAVDVFFLADLVLKFYTAFYNENGVLIKDAPSTVRHFLKTNFIIDFMSIFPVDGIIFATATPRAASLCRFNRLLRSYKFMQFFAYQQRRIGRDGRGIEFLRFITVIFASSNLLACVWFMIACFESCDNYSWAGESGSQIINSSGSHQYIVSLYWATASITAVGYGDVHAISDAEMQMSIFAMIVGIILFGWLIGSLAANIANGDHQRARFAEKLAGLQRYLQRPDVSQSVATRIKAYHEYLWIRNKGVQPHTLFSDLPRALQADLCLDVYGDAIRRVPLFQDGDVDFIRHLALVMRPLMILNGEYIVRKGDIGLEMFFIRRGIVDVVSEDGQVVYASMLEGSFFGEISLLNDCPRTASIRAKTNCDLFTLSKRDFEDVLTSFPHMAAQIHSLASSRIEKVHERSAKSPRMSSVQPEEDYQLEVPTPVDQPSAFNLGLQRSTMDSKDELPNLRRACNVTEAKGMFGGVAITVTAYDQNAVASRRNASPVWIRRSQSATSSKFTVGEDFSSCQNDECCSQKSSTTSINSNLDINSSSKSSSSVSEKPASSDHELDSANEELSRSPWLAKMVVRLFGPIRCILRIVQLPTILDRKWRTLQLLHGIFFTALLVLSFTVPFEVAFQKDGTHLWYLNVTFEFIFALQMFVESHTIISQDNGEILNTLSAISEHYVSRGSFLRDVIAIFPTDIVIYSVNGDVRHLAVIRLLKLLRLPSVAQYFRDWSSSLNAPVMIVRLCRSLLLVLLTMHMVACGWYVTSCPVGCDDVGWVEHSRSGSPEINLHIVYVDSVFWAIATMTTTGYGDFRAHNDSERVFAILVMIGGKLLFGMVLGNIASMLANADYQRVKFKDKLSAIVKYFDDSDVPDTFRHRILRYYQRLWHIEGGLNFSDLFENMPYTLKADVAWNLNQGLLQRVPVLRQDNDGFYSMLSMELRPQCFLRGDWIHKQGDICTDIIFISAGYVEVIQEDKILQVKPANAFFGDDKFLLGTTHNNSFRAATDVEVLVLTANALNRTLVYFPDIKQELNDRAKAATLSKT